MLSAPAAPRPQGLESTISGVILDRTVERSLAAAQHAEARFLASLERIAQGKKLKVGCCPAAHLPLALGLEVAGPGPTWGS